jgi:hypothetical protein
MSTRLHGESLYASVVAVLLALALGATPASAQETPAPEHAKSASEPSPPAPADTNVTTAGADSGQIVAPVSTEQGHTQLPDSFEHRPLEELLRESRFVGIRDTKISVQIRSFYLHDDNFNNSEALASTVGGSAGFKTGYFFAHFAVGATGYTSQRLDGPLDKDGTGLLKPGQRSYTVLGEIYGEALLTETVRAILGRRLLESPYINGNDSKMTPATFQAAAIVGVLGGGGRPALRFGAGYVDKMKDRNSDEFVPMSTIAGSPASIERGVYAAGANFESGDFWIGVAEYYCRDILNIVYAETRDSLALANRIRLRLVAQYSNQRSTGNNLLTGHSFSTDQFGVKADLVLGDALLTAAYTDTGSGADMRSPWGAYPGFTSVQIENFNRAGENAGMLRAAYSLRSVRGLSAYGLYVHGWRPDSPTQYPQDEYDLNVQWDATSGKLKGLTLRARYGHAGRDSPGSPRQNDLRLILYYKLR